MNTYQRNGMTKQPAPTQTKPASGATAQDPAAEQGVRVNGTQQVIDMLLAADPAFRESLLRRIANEQPKLAAALRRELAGRI